MGIIADLLKDVPLSTVLKEKVLGLEDKIGILETENTILNNDLRKAQIEIEQIKTENDGLKEQLDALTNPPISETAKLILFMLAQDVNVYLSKETMGKELNLDKLNREFTVDELERLLYIESTYANEIVYALTHKGKKYVLDNR